MYWKQFNKAGHQGWGCGPKSEKQFQGNQWGGYRRPKYNVPINIVETDTYYEVHVYATGFGKEDIKVSVVDDLLYISGNKEIDEQNVPKFRRQEFPIKTFERTLALNGQVDIKEIGARHENSVLIITLPKTPEAKVTEQNIEVK